MKLQKLGGYAAIASICAYIVCAVYGNLIQPSGFWTDPAKAMAAMSAAPGGFYVSYLLFMVSSILALAMIVALHERMHADAPYLSRMMLIAMSASTAIWITEAIVKIICIGMIVSTQDLSAFRAFRAISIGIHFAGGHAAGWGCLFLGCATLATRSFSRVLGWLFLVTGILWIPTFFLIQIGFRFTIPIFTLMLCVSTIWIGIAMLRQKQLLPAANEMAEAK